MGIFLTEKAMAPHSSTLAWKIPWTEEPGRLQSMGSQRVRQDWATSLSLFTFMHWRRKWQPTLAFLPGESQGWGSLVGCLPSMGSHRVGHDWSDLAAAAYFLMNSLHSLLGGRCYSLDSLFCFILEWEKHYFGSHSKHLFKKTPPHLNLKQIKASGPVQWVSVMFSCFILSDRSKLESFLSSKL